MKAIIKRKCREDEHPMMPPGPLPEIVDFDELHIDLAPATIARRTAPGDSGWIADAGCVKLEWDEGGYVVGIRITADPANDKVFGLPQGGV